MSNIVKCGRNDDDHKDNNKYNKIQLNTLTQSTRAPSIDRRRFHAPFFPASSKCNYWTIHTLSLVNGFVNVSMPRCNAILNERNFIFYSSRCRAHSETRDTFLFSSSFASLTDYTIPFNAVGAFLVPFSSFFFFAFAVVTLVVQRLPFTIDSFWIVNMRE